MSPDSLYRLSAFTTDPNGGNPAGVWLGNVLLRPEEMGAIAADVGFSETAFVAPLGGNQWKIRYYSPEMEVPFCGHATIATGVLLGELQGEGNYELETQVGWVPVAVKACEGGYEASLTSVEPQQAIAEPELVTAVLAALGWGRGDLDGAIEPMLAYGGSWHLVLAAATRGRLDDLDYDFEALKAVMLGAGLLTVQLVWRESERVFHSRNPFPVGGVIEDPATGSAAAALGGYLRSAKLIPVPGRFEIRQGLVMGRPSWIGVEVPIAGGIVVTGRAVRI
ncbi:MAG: PhzF family phenazine biosynthesis protein [Alkalinema sp. RU_4_3]|nr:PhzF family phenazine biosynthesis protein [Alkalinema sp. RU_4_3]